MQKPSLFRKYVMAFLSVTLAATAASGDPLRDAEAEQSKEVESECADMEEGPEIPPPKWELLDFGSFVAEQSGSRRIQRIKLTLPEKQAIPWNAGFMGDKPVVYETEDPRVLKLIEGFLTQPLRIAIRPDMHQFRGEGDIVGTMVVTTNQEEFTIEISLVGFALGTWGPDAQRVFFSWGLAHFLDDLCAKQAGVHIPPKVMRELTGEARMETDRKALEAFKSAGADEVKRSESFEFLVDISPNEQGVLVYTYAKVERAALACRGMSADEFVFLVPRILDETGEKMGEVVADLLAGRSAREATEHRTERVQTNPAFVKMLHDATAIMASKDFVLERREKPRDQ